MLRIGKAAVYFFGECFKRTQGVTLCEQSEPYAVRDRNKANARVDLKGRVMVAGFKIHPVPGLTADFDRYAPTEVSAKH